MTKDELIVWNAAIEAAAKACEARIKNDNGDECSHYAPYNSEDKACAAAVRKLSVEIRT